MARTGEDVPKLRTQAAIAAVYAVDQTTVGQWMKDESFPPKHKDGYDLAAVGTWIRANSDPEKTKEQARKLKLEADRLEIRLSTERGETISLAEVERTWSSGFAALRSEMQKTARSLAPQVSGKDAAECLKLIEDRDRKLLTTVAEVEAD